MKSKYKAYPSYKDSEVGWLGDIPTQWNITKLKYISSVNDDILPDNTADELEIKYIDIGSVSTGCINNFEQIQYVNAPSRAKRIIKDGDMLVSTVRTYLKAIAPVTKLFDGFIASTGFAVIRPSKVLNKNFSKYALLSNYFIDTVEAKSVGISYPAINASDLIALKIVLPPLQEQQTIANYLDIATAKIDTLIAKQTKLIELLAEKRQAVISTAVTRGLDSTVAMKESGVTWLGEIPEHWEVVQSRRLFQERKGRAITNDEQLTASQKYGIIPQKKFMEIEGRKVTQVLKGSKILKHIESNDFVMSMRSFQGGLEYSEYTGCVSSAYVGLIPIKHVYSRFFKYLFKSKPYIQALQSTSNLVRDGQALRFDNFSKVSLVIVPDEEQKTIANYLDKKVTQIDTLITKATQAIELLKERRTALISAVVTGKVDVRENINNKGDR